MTVPGVEPPSIVAPALPLSGGDPTAVLREARASGARRSGGKVRDAPDPVCGRLFAMGAVPTRGRRTCLERTSA